MVSERALHQCPGGIWVGSQLKSADGLHGLDLSSAGRSVEPGQRLRWPSVADLVDDLARAAPPAPAQRAVDERERARRWSPRALAEPLRVVDAGVAEVVEPAGEVDGVRAQERELRRLRTAATARARRERALALLAVEVPGRTVTSRNGEAPSWRGRSGRCARPCCARAPTGRGTSAPRRGRTARSSASTARSFGVTGRTSSISGSRSSSVARRLTNVVFARRMNGGSSPIASRSAPFSRPIAPKVVGEAVDELRRRRRGARRRRVTSCALSTTNDSSACWS